MREEKTAIQAWLERATNDIRFGPDRAAVRRELEAHLEDKTADLRRVFPDMLWTEAQARALDEMGDPEEIGKELARIHKPWLGYFWRASKWAVWLLAAALLVMCVARGGNSASERRPLWEEVTSGGGCVQSQRVELGGYTFQITGACYLDASDNDRYWDGYRLMVRASSPRFWAQFDCNAVYRHMTTVDPDGERWTMGDGISKSGVGQAGKGLFYREFEVYIDAPWREGAQVSLEFDFDLGSFILTAEDIERVVVE